MNSNISVLNQKLELIQWLSTLEDAVIIDKISEIRIQENKDWWNSISENEKESIALGLTDAASGKLQSSSKAKELCLSNVRRK